VIGDSKVGTLVEPKGVFIAWCIWYARSVALPSYRCEPRPYLDCHTRRVALLGSAFIGLEGRQCIAPPKEVAAMPTAKKEPGSEMEVSVPVNN
jgi:hypothetical protein